MANDFDYLDVTKEDIEYAEKILFEAAQLVQQELAAIPDGDVFPVRLKL